MSKKADALRCLESTVVSIEPQPANPILIGGQDSNAVTHFDRHDCRQNHMKTGSPRSFISAVFSIKIRHGVVKRGSARCSTALLASLSFAGCWMFVWTCFQTGVVHSRAIFWPRQIPSPESPAPMESQRRRGRAIRSWRSRSTGRSSR